MLRILPPTLAYREDLSLAPGRETFTPVDGLWIAAVQTLEYSASLSAGERAAVHSNLAALLHAECDLRAADTDGTCYVDVLRGLATALARAGRSANDIAGWYLKLAEQMTGAGANNLSLAAIAQLLRFPHLEPRVLGRVVAHQGRVARNLGDLEAAQDCFESVLAMGRRFADREIQARGLYGLAGVALMKGNHPQGRSGYERALLAAGEAGSDELIGLAHRGLLVVHATAGNLDAALRHAREALRRTPGDADSYAELLANIGTVCGDAGYFEAALAAHTVAANASGSARVRLASLGGAAAAAARLSDHATFEALVSRIDAEIARGTPPHESAVALVELARAFASRGDLRMLPYALTAGKLARQHQYYEIQFAVDELLATAEEDGHTAPARSPRPISDVSSAVLSEIAALTPAGRALAPV